MKKNTRWINFIGGNDLLFTLIILILLGIFLLVFSQMSWLFQPLVIIVSSILMPFVIALLFYYLFDPVIDFLERHKVKRIWGVTLLFVFLIGLLGLLIGFAIRLLRDQVMSFIDSFPAIVESIADTVTSWIDGLPMEDSVSQAIESVEDWLCELRQYISTYLETWSSGLSTFLSGLTNIGMTLVTFPIVLLFLLKDSSRFSAGVLAIVPPTSRTGLIR